MARQLPKLGALARFFRRGTFATVPRARPARRGSTVTQKFDRRQTEPEPEEDSLSFEVPEEYGRPRFADESSAWNLKSILTVGGILVFLFGVYYEMKETSRLVREGNEHLSKIGERLGGFETLDTRLQLLSGQSDRIGSDITPEGRYHPHTSTPQRRNQGRACDASLTHPDSLQPRRTSSQSTTLPASTSACPCSIRLTSSGSASTSSVASSISAARSMISAYTRSRSLSDLSLAPIPTAAITPAAIAIGIVKAPASDAAVVDNEAPTFKIAVPAKAPIEVIDASDVTRCLVSDCR